VGGEELFGSCVVGLEVGVGERPGGEMPPLCGGRRSLRRGGGRGGAVDLGLAADVVGLLGVERLLVLVEPDVGGVVAVVEEDGGVSQLSFSWGEKGRARG